MFWLYYSVVAGITNYGFYFLSGHHWPSLAVAVFCTAAALIEARDLR